MEITVMTYGHPLWDETISFAEDCAWKAGLYEKYGFEKLRDVETTYGAIDQLFCRGLS